MKPDAYEMETRTSRDLDDVSDEGSTASLETSSSSSSSAVELPPEWEVAIADDTGRFYYADNEKKTTSWCPPSKSWKCCFGLPYGWEIAIDSKHFLYYINHNTKLTTYKHPNYENKQFEALHQALQARRRKVCIKRNLRDGFGFVAGSEKPVIIRSVVAGSPADGQLSANDQLFSINGQIAYNLPQPQVISMIRSCTDVLEMEVVATEDIQDVRNQGTLKSALMSRATRERRKSCPVSVRFEEKPEVLSLSTPSILSVNIIKQMIPNVLKIYLENGQTKSFQYNTETTVKEIFDSLVERLQIQASQYFALVLIGPYPNQTIFLQPEDRVTQVVNRKVFSRWECRLELSFVPNDAYALLAQDPVAFDYWYQQTCNSVVKGHFGAELKFDAVMRLAALQIHIAMTNENEEAKFSLKDVSKEYGGLDDFLPNIFIQNFKKKDIKKALSSQLKSLARIAFPGQKLTQLQAKLHYLKIASQNFAFGGKIFSANLVNNDTGSDSSMDSMMDISDVLVSPSKGICTLFSETGNVLQHLADVATVTGIVVTSHMMNKHHLKIFVQDKKAVSLILNPQDADDMAFFIEKCYKMQIEDKPDIPVYNLSKSIPRYKAPKDVKAPPYTEEHSVVPSTWSYVEDVIPTLWLANSALGDQNSPRSIGSKIDFSSGPPQYNAQKSYDRSSFVPFRQRPTVDTLIREMSIRDKKKKNSNTKLNHVKEEQSPTKSVGQFDTTRFGHENGVSEAIEEASPNLTRHIITCSMSSDEESSDDELSDLARKINRAGTVAKFLKNKGKKGSSMDDSYIPVLNNEDEEDSGWRTDTSSNTGSLGRCWSNPWGTFSEEDSSDKDSNKHLTDSDSLLSHRGELANLEQRDSHLGVVDAERNGKALHDIVQNVIVEAGTTLESSPRRSLSREDSHSFDKYLINKVDTIAVSEENPLNDLTSDGDERPSSLLRPLSDISDEVFIVDQKPSIGDGLVKDGESSDENCNKTDFEWCSTPPLPTSQECDLAPCTVSNSLSQHEMLQRPKKHLNSPLAVPSLGSPETHPDDEGTTDLFTDLNLLEDRPQSVNLEDLNIYIPGPPKVATRALSPSELVIPSPPHDFADTVDSEFKYSVAEDDQNCELSESSTLSSGSSSSDEVIEFMENANAKDNIPEGSESPDEEVEFMTPEKINNFRIYEEAKEIAVKNNVNCETEISNQELLGEKKIESPELAKDSGSLKSLPGVRKSQSFNEGKSALFYSSFDRREDDVRYSSLRRQTEPLVLPLLLPKSPSLDLKNERVSSPLFFSVENAQSSHPFKLHSDGSLQYDYCDPFHQMSISKPSSESQKLILPTTPLSLRRNQFMAFSSPENLSKSNSLPSNFSFDEFNDYLDTCKNVVSKLSIFEEQLVSLIEENKRSNRLSFEGNDPDRESYIDMMRICAKSLLNRTKDIVTMSTNGHVKGLHRFVRSSKNEVENLVVSMTTVKNSTTLASLIKDVVVGYKEVITCLKSGVGKPLTDPEIVKLIEKTNDLSFSSNVLIRGLRTY